MKELTPPMEGIRIFELTAFRDDRGFFLESFSEEKLARLGLKERFVQDNHSRSKPGVLRGLHFQSSPPQGKLVYLVKGRIFDVMVDLRRGSPSFGRWCSVELSADKPQLLWIPYGFAHGFCVLSDAAEIEYKCSDFYEPAAEIGVLWNDPALGIPWPVDQQKMHESSNGSQCICLGHTGTVNFDVWHTK